MNRSSRPRISFVTGIDENYFLMCCTLMQSLEQHFPLIPFRVADFGLSEPQKAFFHARGMLLPMPPGMVKGDHPYAFKSRLGSILAPSLGMPVWLDADMIALRDGTRALYEVADAMLAHDRRFAIAPDRGNLDGGDRPLAEIPKSIATPRLVEYLQRRPELSGSRYLNVGWVMFRQGDALEDWRRVAEAYEGDQCWEQNAFNQICYEDTGRVQVLDPRVWNMHGGLLDKLHVGADGITCEGQPCAFAHVTSPHPQHLTWGEMEFEFHGSRYKNFVKFFTFAPLRNLQYALMDAFLKENLDELRELGVLPRPV